MGLSIVFLNTAKILFKTFHGVIRFEYFTSMVLKGNFRYLSVF